MNVTFELVRAAVDAAVSVMVCAAPEVRVSVAGLAATPPGRPVIATLTVPVKELIGLAVMLTGDPVAPAVMVSEVGKRVRV